MNTLKTVEKLKENGQDFDFYPTTPAIINIINHHIEKTHRFKSNRISVLDVGCGNGRTLMALEAGKRYGIEKSAILREQLDPSVIVLGVDFFDNTLFDKTFDVVFTNSPFKNERGEELFPVWAAKVIREARASTVYLVMPTRWKDKKIITDAIDERIPQVENRFMKAPKQYTVLGTESFLDAERAARITVDIVAVHLKEDGEQYNKRLHTDPFENWFKSYFSIPTNQELNKHKKATKTFSSEGLVERRGLVHNLAISYQAEVDHMLSNYKALENLDPDLLETIGISLENVMKAVKLKMKGIKMTYWKLLFDQIEAITSRLTKKSRSALLDRLLDNTAVDFSVSNAEAIILWVIKNANAYFDEQFLNMMDLLTEPKNISAYKSNTKLFVNEDYRYNRWVFVKNVSHFKFDLRLVVPDKDMVFLADFIIVASNLGFDVADTVLPTKQDWQLSNAHEIDYFDHATGKREKLLRAKWFGNGNFHLFLSPKLLMKLNVEHGRLRGWVKTPQEASDEMEYPIKETQQFFGSNIQIAAQEFPLLCA